MKDPMLLAYAKDVLEVSDEDLAKITPAQEQEFKNAFENMMKYKMVAEVTKSKYCAAGLKVGQKIVITGSRIDTEASDCPLCPGLLGGLATKTQVYLDRCSTNGDMTAPMGAIACLDPGLDAGGLGSVSMILRIEPV
ncbi:MAG: hypothetical protein C4520_21810 [Candidatus Abyssobacteria bacterium SURF_5]|uniref:Uncharacterized protein n=1 Tax=Abyssobacteria bacterium (strain SURF_5) TaxID=2093360 RepID=A0A3A4NI64_ABYX5|nr:MAG: hypothetical protein C4520_21810 [Candidatus Abyssubacteria bacterium SURF_5]